MLPYVSMVEEKFAHLSALVAGMALPCRRSAMGQKIALLARRWVKISIVGSASGFEIALLARRRHCFALLKPKWQRTGMDRLQPKLLPFAPCATCLIRHRHGRAGRCVPWSSPQCAQTHQARDLGRLVCCTSVASVLHRCARMFHLHVCCMEAVCVCCMDAVCVLHVHCMHGGACMLRVCSSCVRMGLQVLLHAWCIANACVCTCLCTCLDTCLSTHMPIHSCL